LAGNNQEPLPYQAGCPDGWSEGVKKLKVVKQGKTDLLTGPCPRCKENIVTDVGDTEIASIAPTPDGVMKVYVQCNCGRPHPNPADGDRGCGARGFVYMKRDANGFLYLVDIGTR
jgi:hypothetical protein